MTRASAAHAALVFVGPNASELSLVLIADTIAVDLVASSHW